MQSITWNSCCALDCDALTDVYICIDSSLTTSGAPYIVGRSAISNIVCDSTGKPIRYSYTLTYEEGQLIDPPLDPCAITGVICDDCILNYIDYAISLFPAAAHILTGAGVPDPLLGVDYDLYIDSLTGDYYSKTSGAWGYVGNLVGPTGPAGADTVPVGSIIMGFWSAAPATWLLLAGGTIGNAASGGTVRANADTANLFSYLWTNLANAQAPVSGGRGVSAAADFAANKTIILPDMRGMFPIGKAAGVGTASTIGGTGGAIDHTHAASAAAHYHSMLASSTLNVTSSGGTSGAGSAHHHGQYVTSNTGGSGLRKDFDDDLGGYAAYAQGVNTENESAHTHNINHVHAAANLSGAIGMVAMGHDGDSAIPVSVIAANPPFLAVNFIIKL